MALRNKLSAGISTTAVSVALLALAAPGVAMAQDQTAPDEAATADKDVIIVSGYRESLKSATGTKKNANQIVELVMARTSASCRTARSVN